MTTSKDINDCFFTKVNDQEYEVSMLNVLNNVTICNAAEVEHFKIGSSNHAIIGPSCNKILIVKDDTTNTDTNYLISNNDFAKSEIISFVLSQDKIYVATKKDYDDIYFNVYVLTLSGQIIDTTQFTGEFISLANYNKVCVLYEVNDKFILYVFSPDDTNNYIVLKKHSDENFKYYHLRQNCVYITCNDYHTNNQKLYVADLENITITEITNNWYEFDNLVMTEDNQLYALNWYTTLQQSYSPYFNIYLKCFNIHLKCYIVQNDHTFVIPDVDKQNNYELCLESDACFCSIKIEVIGTKNKHYAVICSNPYSWNKESKTYYFPFLLPDSDE